MNGCDELVNPLANVPVSNAVAETSLSKAGPGSVTG